MNSTDQMRTMAALQEQRTGRKRAKRVRAYQSTLGPRHEEPPLKSELLRRELASLDEKIARTVEAEAKARGDEEHLAVAQIRGKPAEGKRSLVGIRTLQAKAQFDRRYLEAAKRQVEAELEDALAEERNAALRKQAGEAREFASALAKKGGEVDHALLAFVKSYREFTTEIEHARRRGWMPWSTAAAAVCNRALKTALQPIPEFEVRPLGHAERKCFSEIGLSFGNAVRGAAVRLEAAPQQVKPVASDAAVKPNGDKLARRRVDPREFGVEIHENREGADAAHRAAMAGPGGRK